MNEMSLREVKVSVVIPVYTAGRFIGKCVESVLRQTLSQIEIICVDDFSTDDSLSILSTFTDPRLKVIAFPENRGVSAARNAGLDEAAGEYVYFIDSDDWLDPDYLESMYFRARETGEDVVVNSNYIEEFPEQGKRALSSRFGFVEDEPGYYPSVLVQNKFPPVVWARLFRKNFLTENNVRFPGPSVRNGTEDIFFTGLASSYLERSFVFRGPYYHYLQRPESLLHQKDLCFDNIVSHKSLWDERKTRKLPTEGLRLFYGGTVVIDNESKFYLAKTFFSEIAEEVRRHSTLYAPIDIFLMEAVLSCSDYAEFIVRFNPNISVSFIRSRMRK